MNLKSKIATGLLTALLLPSIASADVIGKSWFVDMEDIPFTDETAEILNPLSTLGFYNDADVENEVFYIPPFHPVEGIAGTIAVNKSQIRRADNVNNIRGKFNDAGFDAIAENQSQLTTARASYTNLRERYLNLPEDQEYLRDELKAILDSLKAEVDELKAASANLEAAIPGALREFTAEAMSFEIAAANISLDGLDMTKAADQGLATARLERSIGGNMTVNAVAGFTPEQLTAVRKYKELRQQYQNKPIKFKKLPVKSISWEGLSEVQTEDTQGISKYRSFNGSGTLEGATVNIDFTLAGARDISVAPAPFILPVGASTQLLTKLPKFTATLSCDIKSGWFFKGRTDVKDGLIIYNNDITQNIVSDSYGTTGDEDSPCTLTYEGGGDPSQAVREAAIRKSLDLVYDRLVNLGIQRSNLAKQQRDAYQARVEADIAANRHTGANRGWASAIGGYLSGGWVGLGVGLFSQASNFYWHTDRRNVTVNDRVQFNLKIVEDGNKLETMDLPLQLCVAWQPDYQAYVACTVDQIPRANNMDGAGNAARDSEECEDAETTEECKEAREDEAETNDDNGTIDDDLPEEI
ncbi:MAG: hypothetical protein HRU19_03720 [Pseudobacteriovorax sp.]|nr:hypothetical protein [Pseudobacteriovorax sp.]